MVKALNLSTLKHTNPYKLGWIKKRTESKVGEVCAVPLSIGKVYVEEVIYDVIEMDTYHILLGRPWQFDCDITYKELILFLSIGMEEKSSCCLVQANLQNKRYQILLGPCLQSLALN